MKDAEFHLSSTRVLLISVALIHVEKLPHVVSFQGQLLFQRIRADNKELHLLYVHFIPNNKKNLILFDITSCFCFQGL